MREIVLDIETTGLSPQEDHRIIEIGCVELLNILPTGKIYKQYINPERDMPNEAFQIHGISSEFLVKYPVFDDVVDSFLEFIGDSQLVVHNASFDINFLNFELTKSGQASLSFARVVDTMILARKMFPGAQVNLDALCRRFNIDITERKFHGALKDAELLALVYLELQGGRQKDLELINKNGTDTLGKLTPTSSINAFPTRSHTPSAQEIKNHQVFIDKLNDPVWRS